MISLINNFHLSFDMQQYQKMCMHVYARMDVKKIFELLLLNMTEFIRAFALLMQKYSLH